MKKKYIKPLANMKEAMGEDIMTKVSVPLYDTPADPDGEMESREDNNFIQHKSVWDD